LSSSHTDTLIRRQNDSRLSELSSKVSALRGVTIDIYDNARAQDVIDSTNDTFSTFSTNLKTSARRMTTMAGQGNKVAVFKLAGVIVGVVLVVWFVGGWLLRLFFGGGDGSA